MIKVYYSLIILFLILIFLPVQFVFAGQDKEITTYNINIDLPEVNILPGDFFYFAKGAWESVKSWFVVGKLNQAIYDLELSNKRLTEIELLITQGKVDEARELLEEYQKKVDRVEKSLDKTKETGEKYTNLKTKTEYYLYYHRDIISEIKTQIPDDEKQSIDEINSVIFQAYSHLLDIIREK